MKYEILLNSVLRLPLEKATKLLEEYKSKHEFKNFYEQQKVLDVLTHKVMIKRQIKEEVFKNALLSLAFMCRDAGVMGRMAFESMKGYPMIIWIEVIGEIPPEHMMDLLKNWHKEFESSITETCIINLPANLQLEAIDRYKKEFNVENPMFYNFYYSVSPEARVRLKELFPNVIADDILLELQDLPEDEVLARLSSDKERLMGVSSDDLVEFILLKATTVESLNIFLGLYSEKIKECSTPKFELLFTRYRFIRSGRLRNRYRVSLWDEEEKEEELDLYTDEDLFRIFKDKFHEVGLNETLSLFDHNDNPYSANDFSVDVILELLDVADMSAKDSKYINDATIESVIKKFEAKCRNKEYTLNEFSELVSKIKVGEQSKLVFDDFIEAIIACGYLLKTRVISDKHPLFLELRDKFTKDLLGRCTKDGTYNEDISLNGLFYRLAKGTLPFDKVYMCKTYRGLIYLTKCGTLIDNADYITNFLSDEQLIKLNIKPMLRWKDDVVRTNTKADNLSFKERMGLQLLCYFGSEKGRYLLESDMQGNLMENLFDGLNYKDIVIDENGIPKVNNELIDFLFGRGSVRETNSIMNKLIRGELPDFKKYFTDFCNNYDEVKKACNGVLTVKRIVRYFENVELPIELKPDEVEFKHALKEMNTTNEGLLEEAVELCKEARDRDYSTIPKVEGRMGDFTYKILDLDDPLAVAVGYLSHCCFVVRGISYSALKHSMKSRNGRTFVVYYKGSFLTQSWVWRNGDVICFDSVEAGSPVHGYYQDNIKLVDVYKRAAEQMLYKSYDAEDDIQRVKAVTIGKSDYTFNGLKRVKCDVPRPLESDVYIYDSNTQWILAGDMPDKPRYGVVGMQYHDQRNKPVIISDLGMVDIDELDDAMININSLRYRIHNSEPIVDNSNINKIISGDGWYILMFNDGTHESGVLEGNREIQEEYNNYLTRYVGRSAAKPHVKSLVL